MTEAQLPRLPDTDQPLQLFMEIDLTDPVLGLPTLPIRRLLVMNDVNSDAFWAPLFYSVDEEKPAVQLLSFHQTYRDELSPAILRERSFALQPIDLPAEWDEDEDREYQRMHLFGGRPAWIQGPELLRCTNCGTEMIFAAQFASLLEDNIQFGDMGTLYAFICPKCFVMATTCQCY